MLTTEDRLTQALAHAYRYLNRRERTESEVRRHLEQHNVDPDTIDAAVRELRAQRFLDDARFVSLFVEDRRALDQWGNDRIRRTLKARGVDPGLVEELLAAEPPERELDRALELLARRFPDPPRTRRDRDRALAMMLRKGFDPDLALDALRAHGRAGLED